MRQAGTERGPLLEGWRKRWRTLKQFLDTHGVDDAIRDQRKALWRRMGTAVLPISLRSGVLGQPSWARPGDDGMLLPMKRDLVPY